jgi:hypothetical protein
MNTNIHGARAMARLAIVLALLVPADARAQQRSFCDSSGRLSGRSIIDTKGNTIYYDHMGRNTGRSVTRGNTTTVYDNMGRQTGNITTKEGHRIIRSDRKAAHGGRTRDHQDAGAAGGAQDDRAGDQSLAGSGAGDM